MAIPIITHVRDTKMVIDVVNITKQNIDLLTSKAIDPATVRQFFLASIIHHMPDAFDYLKQKSLEQRSELWLPGGHG